MDLPRPHAGSFAAVVMLSLAAAPDAIAQDTVGYVASVNGTWFTSAQRTQPISAGRVVAHGEEVWAAPRSSAGAYLTVVLRDGNRLALSCAVPGDCDRRHTLRVRGGLLQETTRVVDAVLGLVRRHPEALVSLIARGDAPGPVDIVVRGGVAQIDVSAALADMAAGQYRVTLTGGAAGIAQRAQQAQVEVEGEGAATGTGPGAPTRAWAPGQPLAVPGVTAGLYLLRVQRDEGWPSESWVLVAPPREHARIIAEFARAREVVSAWTGMDAAHDARVFLRAYLAVLADGAPTEEDSR